MSRLEKEKAFAELAVKKGWATPEQGMRCAMEHVQSQGRFLIDQIFIRNKIISADQADEIWKELGGAPGLGVTSREREATPRRAAPPRRTPIAPSSAVPARRGSLSTVAIAVAVAAALVAVLAVVTLTRNGSAAPWTASPAPRPAEPRAPSPSLPAPPPAVPIPPPPQPEPAPVSKERDLLALAEEQFENAKSLFKQGDELGSKKLVEEAGFQAEEARIKFMALQDLAGSPQIRDRIKEVNQLNKMIHDRLKSAGGPPPPAPIEAHPATPAPPPAPPPPPTAQKNPWSSFPPPPRPADPASPPAAALPPAPSDPPAPDMAPVLTSFAAFLEKPETPGDLPSKLSLARDPFGRAAYAVVKMIASGEWKPSAEESTLLRAYAKRFLTDPMSLPHQDAIEFFAKEIELRKLAAPSAEYPVSRTLLLGHLAASQGAGDRLDAILKKHAASLGLEKVSDRWICIEGAAFEAGRSGMSSPETLAAALDQFKAVRDPGWELFQIFSTALLAVRSKGETAQEATLLAIESAKSIRYPPCPAKDEAMKIKNLLSKFRPCKWCKGTNRVPCDYGCDESGQVTKKCAVCNGTGLKPGYLYPPPCPEKIAGGKHTWSDPCPKCKGARNISCRSCKAPFAPPPADLLDSQTCRICSGGGFLLPELKLPCTDCYGVGVRVSLNPKRK